MRRFFKRGSTFMGQNQNALMERKFFDRLNACAIGPVSVSQVRNSICPDMEAGPNEEPEEQQEEEEGVVQLEVGLEPEVPNPNSGEEFLKLNVGGCPFRLTMVTIAKRTKNSLVYKFAQAEHDDRVKMCTSYLRDSGIEEYFFERSALLFEAIYTYYITGECHKPQNPCLELFAIELAFWNLTDAFFPQCCWSASRKIKHEDSEKEVVEKDPFLNVCCGSARKRIYEFVDVPESSSAAKIFSIVSVSAVLVSVLTLILGSIPVFQVTTAVPTPAPGTNETVWVNEPHEALEHVEYICIAFFTFEYLSKMIVSPERRVLFFQLMNIIDLIAILPTYLELGLFLAGFDTAQIQQLKGALLVMRILRVLRVIRLLKLGRHSTGLRIFAKTIQRSGAQLGMLLVVLGIGVIFFSTMLYFIEKDEPATQFYSIPAGFWWCIVTMSTVGYGDMVPTTLVGKLVGSCCIACGALVLALPITVMVENFMRVQDEFKNRMPKAGERRMTRWGRPLEPE